MEGIIIYQISRKRSRKSIRLINAATKKSNHKNKRKPMHRDMKEKYSSGRNSGLSCTKVETLTYIAKREYFKEKLKKQNIVSEIRVFQRIKPRMKKEIDSSIEFESKET